MEYRRLPRGTERERFSVLGLGTGSLGDASEDEIETVIRTAMEHGINYFDLCAGAKKVYAPFGRAIAGQREKVFFPLHFGAVYNEEGQYGWSRDAAVIRRTIDWELEQLHTGYADIGYLHCVDDEDDLEQLLKGGILDMILKMKEERIVHHAGFSSHTPAIANRLLDTGLIDFCLFSINPAYDFECGDEYGIGSGTERYELFRRCERERVGISVMKPFHGGKLLSAEASPFHKAMTQSQCLQYVLDRPGVITAVPGVRSLDELKQLLPFIDAAPEEKDYSVIAGFTPEKVAGSCVYCAHCQPCPKGIDIGLVNKYYDLAKAGDAMAADHYRKLKINASVCIHCGHCSRRCPFGVHQSERMEEISRYFSE